MSHRDQDGHTASASHAQDLRRALGWLLESVDAASRRMRKDSRLSLRGLIVTALLWVWSDEPGLTQRFAQAMKIARRLFPREVTQAISYQAFLKNLRRWTEPLRSCFAAALRQRMQTDLAAYWRIGGFSVFGVDGSRLELPRTASNERQFASKKACAKGGKSRPAKKAEGPQLWLTLLWHVGSALPWDWRIGPGHSSERAHLGEMIESLPADALLTADGGFVGYAFWTRLLQSGRAFLIRVGGNVRLLQRLGWAQREGKQTVYLWPAQAAREKQPPLVLRLVIVQQRGQRCYLVTSVCDRRRLSDRQIAEIYRLRWGIEVYYRHFKQTFGRRKLRSHKAEHAELEAHWAMLGLWAMLLQAAVHLDRRQVPPPQLSVAGVLRAYRRPMREYKSAPDPGESLWELLAAAVRDRYPRRAKASRGYPQKKYDPPPTRPHIRSATPEEIALAQTIPHSCTEKGLTA